VWRSSLPDVRGARTAGRLSALRYASAACWRVASSQARGARARLERMHLKYVFKIQGKTEQSERYKTTESPASRKAKASAGGSWTLPRSDGAPSLAAAPAPGRGACQPDIPGTTEARCGRHAANRASPEPAEGLLALFGSVKSLGIPPFPCVCNQITLLRLGSITDLVARGVALHMGERGRETFITELGEGRKRQYREK